MTAQRPKKVKELTEQETKEVVMSQRAGSCLVRVVVEEWDWRVVVVCVGEEVMAAAWLHIVEAMQW